MDLFPYAPREFQRDIVAFLGTGLNGPARHVILESGTGTGKTVCALTAALTQALASQKRVLYLTRTNSQGRQVVDEFRAIRKRQPEVGTLVALQGRQHMCPLAREDSEMGHANAEELGIMCRDRMRAAEDKLQGNKTRHEPCRYYERTFDVESRDAFLAWLRDATPTAEDVAAQAGVKGLCPYTLTRELMPEARVIVAPYVYFFAPALRQAFLSWAAAEVQDFIVVVDEAHNLPEFARELASAELGRRTLELALREVEDFGNPTVLSDMPLKLFLSTLHKLIGDVAREYVPEGEEDALLPPEEIDAELIHAFRAPTPRIEKALTVIDEYAEGVREARRRAGRIPRSYVGAVSAFLRFYRGADESTHVRLVVGGDDPKLQCYAVDPSVASEILLRCAGSISMSGTLAPLEEYRDSIGLPAQTPLQTFPSPFPLANRLAVFDATVTTRHEEIARDPTMWTRIGERVRALREATDRNMAVFVPSYEALHKLAKFLQGTPGLFREHSGGGQSALMTDLAQFKATRGATLLCVMGGRVSEGLDFPDDQLEVVVIIGLPYPKPTARQKALLRFYDRRFGQGWAYAVDAPMRRKLLQAAGRLIRTPTDRGLVVLMDKRAALLRESVPDLRAAANPALEATRFFNAREKQV